MNMRAGIVHKKKTAETMTVIAGISMVSIIFYLTLAMLTDNMSDPVFSACLIALGFAAFGTAIGLLFLKKRAEKKNVILSVCILLGLLLFCAMINNNKGEVQSYLISLYLAITGGFVYWAWSSKKK